jgi:hypothetical protein
LARVPFGVHEVTETGACIKAGTVGVRQKALSSDAARV